MDLRQSSMGPKDFRIANFRKLKSDNLCDRNIFHNIVGFKFNIYLYMAIWHICIMQHEAWCYAPIHRLLSSRYVWPTQKWKLIKNITTTTTTTTYMRKDAKAKCNNPKKREKLMLMMIHLHESKWYSTLQMTDLFFVFNFFFRFLVCLWNIS